MRKLIGCLLITAAAAVLGAIAPEPAAAVDYCRTAPTYEAVYAAVTGEGTSFPQAQLPTGDRTPRCVEYADCWALAAVRDRADDETIDEAYLLACTRFAY